MHIGLRPTRVSRFYDALASGIMVCCGNEASRIAEVMKTTKQHLRQFEEEGFFFIEFPFSQDQFRQIEVLQRQNYDRWAQTKWPDGMNRLACQFLMLGEPILKMVEQSDLLQMARSLLNCDQIHVGACGIGNAIEGYVQPQTPWHADGEPNSKQVSFRTALDRHDTNLGPLRILPGSHNRSRDEVKFELLQYELATGSHDQAPAKMFAKHPQELEVILDPRWTMVWSPSCWHASGVKLDAGLRRAMGWNYFPKGGRHRDFKAIKYIFADQWPQWSPERKQLWGLTD